MRVCGVAIANANINITRDSSMGDLQQVRSSVTRQSLAYACPFG